MELFDKMLLSKDPLTHNLLLNKNDFIRFLKTEKLFKKVEELNIYNQQSKEKEILNFYHEHRNNLKVKKYYKILRVKIEKYFYPPKPYLEKLERINKTMLDLQDFEKQLFQKDVVSDVDSDDSEALKMAENDKTRKQKVYVKEKTINNKKKFANPLTNPQKVIEFMKDNTDLISRYLNFTRRKKSSKSKDVTSKKSLKKDKDEKSESTCIALIVKKDVLKKDPKYENFYKKRLRKEQNNDQIKEDIEYKLSNEENQNENNAEGMKTIKVSINDQKETLNNSYMIVNKEPSLNFNVNKNNGDNFYITNIKENNEAKNLPSNTNNYLSSNKALKTNIMVTNNSVLNNSISQNNNLILDTETGNLNKDNRNFSGKFSSPNKLQNRNNIDYSPKITTKRRQSVKNNPFSSNKSIHFNPLNSNQTNNNNLNNNNNNYDYQNTSMSSSASVFLNRSIRHFQGFNNSNIKGSNYRNENLFPLRVFSANNLNSNFPDRRNNRSILKSNENSQNYGNYNNFKAKNSLNINNTQKKSQNRISNKEREFMFRIKKLNEEISNMAPVNEDQLEKITKRTDFQRGGNSKKVKSEFRATKFYQDKNYEKITSNFKKTSLDKLNAFYADKFNLNDNMKLNAEYRDYFTVDLDNEIDNDNMVKPEKIYFKEQNPILIDFNARKKDKKLNNDLSSKNKNFNLIENKTIKKKNKLFDEIAKIEDNSQMKKLELKHLNSNVKPPSNSSIKQLLFKAKKNIDLEELKGMVMDRIIEFKNSKGFLSEDFDSDKNLNKISKVKYDLYSFINKKK